MSEIGYYRLKIKSSQSRDVNMYINGALASTKRIEVKEYCEGDKIVKFLNKDGQYRFFSFNRFWESSEKPKQIGSVNKLITSLISSQASLDNVGYRSEKFLNVVAHDVSQGDLDIISDLWTSPRVYLYTGDGAQYNEKDYVQVVIKSKNNISKIKKGSYVDIQAEILLPETYTINMI